MNNDSYTIAKWGNIAHTLVQPLSHWSSRDYWFTDILLLTHGSLKRLTLPRSRTGDGFASCKSREARTQTDAGITNLTLDERTGGCTKNAMSITALRSRWILKCVGSFRSAKLKLKKLISTRTNTTSGRGIWSAGNYISTVHDTRGKAAGS